MSSSDQRGTAERAFTAPAQSPLRIVVGLETLKLGGTPLNALDLAREMRRRGHEVSVFAIRDDPQVSVRPYAEQCGFDVTVLPARNSSFKLAGDIRRFIVERDADVVHVYGPWLGRPAALALRGTRKRVAVVTNWMMENVFYTGALPVIVGTRQLRDEAAVRVRGRVWLVEPPIDLEVDRPDAEARNLFRDENGIGADERLAVIVNRIDHHMKLEGILNSIRAVGELDRPDLRLIVVGDGDAIDLVRELAAGVNAELGREAVMVPGKLTNPHPVYAAADLVLGMGGSALRGLAHGVPLVVLGENGYSAKFDETTAEHFLAVGFWGTETTDAPVKHLAGLIDSMLEAAAGSSNLGLELVRERFGLGAAADSLEEIYRHSLDSRSHGFTALAEWVGVVLRQTLHETRRTMRSTATRLVRSWPTSQRPKPDSATQAGGC